MEQLESALAKARKERRQARRERTDVRREYDVPKEDDTSQPDDVSRPDDVSQNWGALPSIEIKRRAAARLRLGALMGGVDAAPYDILRARLLRRMQQEGWRRLVVTSPNQGCGKSSISANLAISLARQSDFRVILMDFDLRRPALAALFGDRSDHSIADLLRGRAEFKDYAVRLGMNLAVCTSRGPVQQSAELLRSQTTADLLAELESQWKPDLMIFDTPPMLGSDDTLGFLPRADSALLIAAAGSTTLNQIDACERELSDITNVVGTVLNKCRYLNTDDEYGYGY